jgi:CheY-like chemotaxis protein
MEHKIILIVDDDERNIFALSAVMQHKGYFVKSALDGKSCISILKENPNIKIVLMDIMMPIMDGYQAIKLIRADDELKQIPIIALTASTLESDKTKCLQAGASDFLSKPLNIVELLTKIDSFLS